MILPYLSILHRLASHIEYSPTSAVVVLRNEPRSLPLATSLAKPWLVLLLYILLVVHHLVILPSAPFILAIANPAVAIDSIVVLRASITFAWLVLLQMLS